MRVVEEVERLHSEVQRFRFCERQLFAHLCRGYTVVHCQPSGFIDLLSLA